MAKWNKNNKEEYNQARREWYQKNKEAERARLKISNARRRRELLQWCDDYKAEKGCSYCTESDPCCLDFHHDNDDKEANIANILNKWSKDRVLKEMEKCTVVCANCHRKLHRNQVLVSPQATNLLKG